MKKTQRRALLFLLLGLLLTTVQAQEATVAAGGDAKGSGGSVSYSIGQIVYTTNTGSTSSVGSGVQQPYKILVVTGIEAAKGILLQCSAYPNPTIDYFTLQVENFQPSTFNFQLYDISGKLLDNKKLTDNQTTIVMSDYAAATYFLKVSDNNKEV